MQVVIESLPGSAVSPSEESCVIRYAHPHSGFKPCNTTGQKTAGVISLKSEAEPGQRFGSARISRWREDYHYDRVPH